MTHTEIINGQEVIFITLEVAERIEHSTEYFMNGYTGEKLNSINGWYVDTEAKAIKKAMIKTEISAT